MAASPGFSTSGASAAMMSAFALAAGDSVSSSAVACCATCRFGCVRRRATLAGPRFAGVMLPLLHRREQRQRRTPDASGSDRTAASSWCGPAPRPARRRRRCPGCRRASRSGAPFSASGRSRVGEHRGDRGERRRRAAPAPRAGCRRCRRGDRRSSRCRRDRQQHRRRALSAFALSAPALSHFATIGSAAAVVAGSSSSFCRACVVGGVEGQRPAFHPRHGPDDAGLERGRLASRRRRRRRAAGPRARAARPAEPR